MLYNCSIRFLKLFTVCRTDICSCLTLSYNNKILDIIFWYLYINKKNQSSNNLCKKWVSFQLSVCYWVKPSNCQGIFWFFYLLWTLLWRTRIFPGTCQCWPAAPAGRGWRLVRRDGRDGHLPPRFQNTENTCKYDFELVGIHLVFCQLTNHYIYCLLYCYKEILLNMIHQKFQLLIS